MRRSTQVLLVLMGGGMVSAAAIPLLRQPDCDPALQQAGACPSNSSSSRSSTSSGGWGRSSSSSTSADAGAATTGVSRGGFGATGAARASSGS